MVSMNSKDSDDFVYLEVRFQSVQMSSSRIRDITDGDSNNIRYVRSVIENLKPGVGRKHEE
jgi:hypothetical protein